MAINFNDRPWHCCHEPFSVLPWESFGISKRRDGKRRTYRLEDIKETGLRNVITGDGSINHELNLFF